MLQAQNTEIPPGIVEFVTGACMFLAGVRAVLAEM